MKNILKFCAITNFMVALLLKNSFDSSLFNAIFLVMTGIYYLYCSNLNDEELFKHKVTLIVLGVISVFFNFLTTIALLFNIKYINNLHKENDHSIKINKEVRRVDLLLKLGVFLVVMAGIIFAMTTWDNIYSIIKVLSLIIMSGLFLGLSIFTEKKLKIDQSAKTYWILSVVFLALSFLAAENLGVLGSWFSLDGKGSLLFCAAFTLLMSILSFITYIKFKFNYYFYLFLIMITLSFACLLGFMKISFDIVLLSLIVLNAIMYFVNKGKTKIFKYFKSFSFITTFVLSILILIIGNSLNNNISILLISNIILMVNIIYITYDQKENLSTLISPLLLLSLIANGISYFSLSITKFILLLSLIYFTIYMIFLIFKILKNNKNLNITFTFTINMAFLVLFFLSFFTDSSTVLIISTLALIGNISSNYIFDKNNSIKIEYYLQPIKILMVSAAIIYWISVNILYVSNLWYLCIAYLLMLMFYLITKEKILKNIYFIFFVTTLITSLYVDLLSIKMIIPSIFILISFLILYYIIKESKDKIYAKFVIPSFIIMLVTTYLIVVNANVFNIDILFSSLIVLIIYLLIAFVNRKDKVLYTITTIALLLPYTVFITNLVLDKQLSVILISSLYFYVTYLLCNNYIVDDKHKNLISSLCTTVILLSIIFNQGLEVGLFVGLISIGLMLIGYFTSNYKLLIKVGVGSTLLNIIVQFQNLWDKIPFWLYLLVSGLVLIAIVTYKEIKK